MNFFNQVAYELYLIFSLLVLFVVVVVVFFTLYGRTYPQWSFNPKRLIFVALCNDLIDYCIVCFEHQCNTMRVF